MQYLSLKPDLPEAYARYDAFWNRAILDRPPVSISLPKPGWGRSARKRFETWEAYWLDTEYRANEEAERLHATRFLYDALPVTFPNMGPEIFSACCGCGYEYGETTTWTTPIVTDWKKDAKKTVFRADHPLFQALMEYSRRLVDHGRGHFLVGLTDFHPGGDHLAALRDPEKLAMDLIDCPAEVKKALKASYPAYMQVYNLFYELLRAEDIPITSWLPLVYEGKYYIPSCDFSCMISPSMFEEFFLPGIVDECAFYDRSIYHLDGPGALKHLDAILGIEKLHAVQWVCGAGNEGFARWADVHKRIQAAGKAQVLYVHMKELPLVFEALRPEGVWFDGIGGVEDEETAAAVVKRIEAWR